MLTTTQENRIVKCLMISAAIIYIINAIVWDGSYGGGDGIRHYLVARYSWKHPEQLLYSWGKPFFTLVSSPFAQFGLKGIKIYNSLLGIATAYLSFLIARKLNLKHAWLILVMVLFTPLFVQTVNSGLTEPLFAFMIMFCAWLFISEKYLWATLFISFLPFVRSEGNFILPLFACILFIRKRFLLIPLLTFGTIAYSIIGYFYYHDIFWIQTQNPYKGNNFDIYGKGPLNHYLMAYDEILGIPLTIFYCIGLMVILVLSLKRIPEIKKLFNNKDLFYEELFLIHAVYIVYFIAHSIFWWKGLFGSLGLIRSLAGVVPFAAFTSYRGALFLFKWINKYKFVTALASVTVSFLLIFYAFQPKYFPLQLEPEEAVIKETCDWYKTTNYHPPIIYYLFPWLAHGLNIDAFDRIHTGELWVMMKDIKKYGIDSVLPVGSLIFWDGHFGPNESYLPLDTLLNDSRFNLIKTFKPAEPFKTLGGYDFSVNVFERKATGIQSKSLNRYFDLETASELLNYNTVMDTNAHSGKRACVMNALNEYGIMYEKNMSELTGINMLSKLQVGIYIKSPQAISSASIVFSIEDKEGKIIQYLSTKIETTSSDWQNFKTIFQLDQQYLVTGNKLKLYIWNKGKEQFLVDDLSIVISE